MMVVEVLRSTYSSKHGFLRHGMVLSVDTATGLRWIERRIARNPEVKKHEGQAEGHAVQEIAEGSDEGMVGAVGSEQDSEKLSSENAEAAEPLEGRTRKELMNEAVRIGLKIRTNAPKAEIIEALNAVQE